MLLKEISQKTKYRPEVFLDMDGVLADFFAEYAKLAGLPAGSSYRDVPPAKNDPTLNKMIGTDFFYRLPKFPVADTIVALSVKLFGSYNICSSPLRGDHENSGVQKTRWLRENLSIQPKHIYIESRKEKHAVQPDGTPNILIDDRKDNIIKWEAAGGVGIKFQADEDGVDVITNGMRRALEIYRGQREQDRLDLTPSLDRGAPVATDKDLKEDDVIIDRQGVQSRS
jgi:5'(3')-deoxyribonucleotidase